MALTNLYKELEDTLEYNYKTFDDILCAYIHSDKETHLSVKIADTPDVRKIKFDNLKEVDYYSGYGMQIIYGYVWFKDGTWLERGEYDGSEWWEYKATPEIPEMLRNLYTM